MRRPEFNIALKLPLALVGSALVVGLCIGLAAYEIGIRTVEAQSAANIETAVNSSIDHLNDFFGNTEVDLQILAQRPDTAVSIRSMSAAIGTLAATGDPAEILQNAYIAQNPNSEIERDQLDQSAGLAGDYDGLHAAVHPLMRTLLLQRGYTDLLMLDSSGRVVYTTEKTNDFGTVPTGGGNGLALVFKAALAAPAGTVVFQDFTKYAPADGQAMSFMAIPVFDGDAPVGVVAFELSDSLLATKISSVRGIGQTGEAIIVGPDKLMRTQSRYSIASDVLATSMDSDVVNSALAGTPASGTLDNFRGTQATISAVPFEVLGTQWAMVAAQDTDEVFAPVGEMGRTILLLGSALLIIATLVGLWIARSISRPVTAMTRAMAEMAGGDLEVEVVGASRHDELGRMARAVEVFRQNGLRIRELTLEEAALVERNRKARADMMAELRDSFGEVVGAANQGDFSGRVSADFADDELNVLAVNVNEMVETVERGLAESGAVLAAIAKTDLTRRVTGHYEGAFKRLKMDTNDVAERLSDVVVNLKLASKGLKTATSEIAGGAGDLSERTAKQSVTLQQASEVMMQLAGTVLKNAERAREASTNAGHVTQTAEQGGAVMRQATEAMDLIAASSGKISRIMGLIDDIAFQTNLLALNASVEAARAGEAGKGFAVVAVEVRRLAQSAAGASKDIKALIDQSAGQVGTGTQLVGQAAARLEEMLTAARANSELLDGIARESSEQAVAIDEVNHSVRNLDEMTQHNASLVEEMNSAIVQTDSQASELDRIVDLFTTGSGHWRSKSGDGNAAATFPAAAKRA